MLRRLFFSGLAKAILFLFFGGTAAAQTACSDDDIRNFQSSVAWANSGDPSYTRLNITPGTYGAFGTYCFKPGAVNWSDCVRSYGERYRIVATSGATQRWSIALCGRTRQANGWFNFEHRVYTSASANPIYYGPRVRFQWQLGNGNWQTLTGNDGAALDFTLSPNTRTKLGWKGFSTNPRRWRVIVDQAMRNDEFDIIMDW